MAKGVLLGVIGCVTVLPALILILDKPLQKNKAQGIDSQHGQIRKRHCQGVSPCFWSSSLCLFRLPITDTAKPTMKFIYDMGQCLPEDMEYVIANSKLAEDFQHRLYPHAADRHGSSHEECPQDDRRDGTGGRCQICSGFGVSGRLPCAGGNPAEFVVEILKSDKWELMLINSEYKVASDEVNEQITQLNAILKRYDEGGMLIGEAPCMKDMIENHCP